MRQLPRMYQVRGLWKCELLRGSIYLFRICQLELINPSKLVHIDKLKFPSRYSHHGLSSGEQSSMVEKADRTKAGVPGGVAGNRGGLPSGSDI